ncbi:MAG TPA: flagellar motor switch protein FliG [Vicinamibacterales bacterium]|nr:flagellar motor switch protein FliG [Vicinamibacterales bacterium]
MSGVRKAAILTMLLGDDTTSAIFKHLSEDEIETIAREVTAVGSVPAQSGEHVLDEFFQMSQAAAYVAHGGVEYAQRLLVRTVGTEAAARIIDRVVRSFESTAGFTALARADPTHLSKFVLGEQPQTVALILAHLEAKHAAKLVSLLPESLRVDVITRMANLDDISPDVVARISSVIEQRLKTFGNASHRAQGGVRAVAELLNRLERSLSQTVIEAVEHGSPDLAVSIRNLMFVFDDLAHVDDAALRQVIQRVDRRALTVALKGATEDIKAAFFRNMSKRAGDLVREEIEVMGAVRLRDVEAAQQEIVAVARKLEEEGLLETGAAAGEAYVV